MVFRAIVKPFYRENSGLFVFLITVLFCVVSKVDGAGIIEYHLSLITGLLRSPVFLVLVFLCWGLYARKCFAFTVTLLKKPAYQFLSLFNALGRRKRFFIFLYTVSLLLLPVILYGIIIVWVGCKQHAYLPVAVMVIYLTGLCILLAGGLVTVLQDPQKQQPVLIRKFRIHSPLPVSYARVLLRWVANEQKIIWFGSQLFACGFLYLTARSNSVVEYDMSVPFLFFNFGILSNAILIYRLRQFEENYLRFYRVLPVSLFRRYIQYVFVYLVLLIPECVTIGMLLPVQLHIMDGFYFMISAFSLLLLMHSIRFMEDFRMKQYLKFLLVIFCIQVAGLMTIGLGWLSVIFLGVSLLVYMGAYYRFEKMSSDL